MTINNVLIVKAKLHFQITTVVQYTTFNKIHQYIGANSTRLNNGIPEDAKDKLWFL